MEYLPIYLSVAAAIFCVAAILITKVLLKDTILKSGVPNFIEQYLDKLKYKLERTRTGITIQQYMALQVSCPAMLAVLGFFLTDDTKLILVLALLGLTLPTMFLTIKKGEEDKKFEGRFLRALAQMASSLHSGMTVEQAVNSVIDCELMDDSIRDDFRALSSKLKLGESIQDTFFGYAEKTGNKDVHDVATAITIMTAVGGDAGEAIEKLQRNIEDRFMYRKKRESMMTESKIIALFSDIMPILILVGTYIFMPDVIASYFQDTTMLLIFAGVIGVLLVGSYIVHKMLDDKADVS